MKSSFDAVQLFGVWNLISAVAKDPSSGTLNGSIMGERPEGRIIYTPGGHVSTVIQFDGRVPLTNLAQPEPEEAAAAYATYVAYSGRYTVEGDRVFHNVDICWLPNWAGTTLVRVARFEGDQLYLSTPPMTGPGSNQLQWTFGWRRAE